MRQLLFALEARDVVTEVFLQTAWAGLSIESWRKTRLLLNGAFHTVAMPKRQQDGDPEPKKRKKKTQGHDDDCEGERGFLVTGMTCQNALRGLKDLRLWLEVEAEVAGTTDEAAERPQGVAESLDAELAELRSDPAQRRFLTVGMVCKEVAFLRCQHQADLPSGLAKKCLGPSAARRFVSRFADRVLPVDGSTRPKLESFKSLAEGMLAGHGACSMKPSGADGTPSPKRMPWKPASSTWAPTLKVSVSRR